MSVVGAALRGFGRALTHGKNWSKARSAAKEKPRKTLRSSKTGAIKSVKPQVKPSGTKSLIDKYKANSADVKDLLLIH